MYPGPPELGRGVVVLPGQDAPTGFPADAPRIVVDDVVLAHPEPAVAALHHHWVTRTPVVIELAADNAAMRAPETDDRPPWDLPHGFTFPRERLHFLIWANTYDARDGHPTWWHGELAARRAGAPASPDDPADALIDGHPVWCDGGPRGPIRVDGQHVTTIDDRPILHRETIARHQATVLGAKIPDQADLAPDQYAAVTHAGGPARIVAPAGSGKTRVLTARLRHLLRDRRYEPAIVTAVAYNTRAAAEMRDRLSGLRADVRTLHSLGLWICNIEGRRDLVDERGQRAILERIVRTARIPNTDPQLAYLEALTQVRLGLVHPDAVEAARDDVDDLAEVVTRYREELARRNQMDFDEQIFHAIELLLTNPSIRATAQERCTHLLVDEFQDLTPAFHLLVRLVASPALQVFAVGDDDQVIYGYAGADPDYLVDFAHDFPGADFHPLEVNYRCPPAVVAGAVNLLARNQRRVLKDIRAGSVAGDTPVLRRVEAGAMAVTAQQLVEDWLEDGSVPADIAILTRVNSSLLPIHVTLGAAGIPRNATLGVSIMQRTGIRTALAYLRLGLDPERMRRPDIMETINRPARKVKSAVADLLTGQRFSMSQLSGLTSVLSRTHGDRWADYLREIQRLSDAITDGADTATCFAIIKNHIGLGQAMETLDASRSQADGSTHGDDLDALAQLAHLHTDPATFADWLREELDRPGDDDGVVLSTVHRVKGMEWDRVIVFAANSGLFPHRLSEDIEEERRVFHVAVTRCRQSLAIVSDRDAVSPFVAELSTPAVGTADEKATASVPAVTPQRGAGDTIVAEPGLVLGLPGGVTGTVQRVIRRAGVNVIDLLVHGAAATIACDAPVTVDGQPVRLEVRAARRTAKDLFGDGPSPTSLTAPGIADEDLTGPDLARFDKLRAWRAGIAKDAGIPAYRVFSNVTLRGIARANPTQPGELIRVYGIGENKLDLYGDDVLALLEEVDA